MSNEFFTSSSTPATGAQGSSATIRAEFEQIAAAFDKLPVLAGNAGEIVSINGTGTALEASGMTLGQIVTAASSNTLTNKTLNWADNTIGTIPIEGGGTGATTLEAAQAALGINLKADATNAILAGVPTTETAPLGTATTRLATTAFVANTVAAVIVEAGAISQSNSIPLVDLSTGSAGTGSAVSRDDHRHPVDTSRMAVAGGTFTGNAAGITQATGDNSTLFATTAWVRNAFPTIAIATSQVTGLDTALAAKAPLASPTFTGTPLLTTTPSIGDSTKKIATTEFVAVAISTATSGSLGLTPSVVGTANGVAAVGVSGDAAHADHVHPYDTTKQNVITGAASSITSSNLTASRAVVSDVSGKVAVSAVTADEVAHLSGVTFAIQSQLNAKQASDTLLTNLAAQVTAAGKIQGYSGVDTPTLLSTGTASGNIPLWESLLLNAIASKTVAYSVLSTDRGKLINFSGLAGNIDCTLPAVAVGDGFSGAVRNSDATYTVTLKAAATIDGVAGATGIALAPGESCFYGTNGTAWMTVGRTVSYACRAWVNFNGTGTVAIRASGNVSSITDNGVGDYTVNFTTAMPDANYAPVVSSDSVSATNSCNPQTRSTTSCGIQTTQNGALSDIASIMLAVFR